ncbi:hypothetical protein GIY56_15795 [Paracoccus sp. YIM 132242]|uniref:Sulfotransferase domain-containing protein n=1 Tax=Paracoccus lichenicola TaxID=2665644 RepID=A0A6L6HU58_9RHOB|nr:hypothetical protein [Paracoccus lichenicola]MTE01753.1 hypothetical protein [Paracoccus lichenicola]
MRRVIFHVGPEKTGSTLVQAYFDLNKDAVRDGAGKPVAFFGPVAVRDSGLLAEAQAIVGGAQGTIPGLAALLAQAGDASTVVISHESLFGHPDTAGFYGSEGGRRTLIHRFLAASGDCAEFVFYYKQPHKLIESYYRHHVMHGGRLAPMDYLERVPLLKMSFVSLKKDLDTLAGAGRVRMLDARIRDPEAFFRQFCKALDFTIAKETLAVPAQTNKSWSALKTELTRIANARMNPAERLGWLRAMASTPLGEDSDAPMVPRIVTELVERVYQDEHRELITQLADKALEDAS